LIELWYVSLSLLAVAFGAWFEIHSKYSERVVNMKNARLRKAYDKVEEIAKIKQKDKMQPELIALNKMYEASNEPTELHESTWNFFCYAGLLFLISIFCRLGADLLPIQELLPFESFIFLAGTIFFVGAILNTRNLMKLLKSENDPHISLATMIIVALIQALHIYIIWELIPAFLTSTLTIYQEVFFFLLWLTFIGSGIFILKADEFEKSKVAMVGMVLMFAPWIWIFIIIFRTYLNQLL